MIVLPVDASASSSFDYASNADPFHIEYGDDSAYDGALIVDTLQIGETKMKEVTMGLVDASKNVIEVGEPVGNGLWGISFSVGQANAVLDKVKPYESVLQKMKSDGAIKSMSYSLWLDSLGRPIFFLSLKRTAAADSLIDRLEKWQHSVRWSRLCQIYTSADRCPNHQVSQTSDL